MRCCVQVVLGLFMCAITIPAVVGQGPAAKAKVELRWVEGKHIKGVTEDKGFQCSCDPKSIVYKHKKPALVLTKNEVANAVLTTHDFSKSGLSSELCMVTLHLTKKAREQLAAACKGNEMRLLTVVIDGRQWGTYRYEIDKDKKFVPDAARAESFTPSVGFFSSKAEAQRLVDGVK